MNYSLNLSQEEEYGLIVYENAMESYFEVQSGNLGQITRDSNYM